MPTERDECREAFERWCVRVMKYEPDELERIDGRGYIQPNVVLMWMGWRGASAWAASKSKGEGDDDGK